MMMFDRLMCCFWIRQQFPDVDSNFSEKIDKKLMKDQYMYLSELRTIFNPQQPNL